MMLNTYEHGWSDGVRGYESICKRSPDYQAGYEAARQARRRDRLMMHAVAASFVVTALTAGLLGLGGLS